MEEIKKEIVHRLHWFTQINFNVRNQIDCPQVYFYFPLGAGGNYCPQITLIYTDFLFYKRIKEKSVHCHPFWGLLFMHISQSF